MRSTRRVPIALIAAVVAAAGVAVYTRWERGDPVHVPFTNRSYFRFPCSSYTYVSPPQPEAIQAFGVIDGAALAARSNRPKDVVALVDVVFDRELPQIRCGSPLRKRVAGGERAFRDGSRPAISETRFVDAANAELAAAEAPDWARVSAEEVHVLRDGLRGLLPRFIGTVASTYQLSDQMTPTEAALVAMTLGKGLVYSREEFDKGPDAWVARAEARRNAPPRPPRPPTLRVSAVARDTANLVDKLDDEKSRTFEPANRFLDRLGFPR